ncbi:MAG: hypothetical protein RL748_651, partial [Pseudomonadota bacterium]
IAATPALLAQGVRPGMRAASVALLAPDAQVQVRDPGREHLALQAAALALLQYTPQLALGEFNTLLLDIGASLRLFGGIRALRRRVALSMQQLGLCASISCAPTARAAWLLAQSAKNGHKPQVRPSRGEWRHCLKLKRLAQRLNPLPVALLPTLKSYLPWLDGIGCEDLAALRRLPRAGLQRRCGKVVLEMLDAAYGEAPELYEWITAPLQFRARYEFFSRIEHVEAMTHAATSMLTQMHGWLCAHHGMLNRIVLLLEYERGRAAIEPTRIEIMLAEPTWHTAHLLMLLKERLRQVSLSAPVMAIILEAGEILPMTLPSDSLFPEPGGTAADYQRLLELLSARLGADNVQQPQAKADHRPEVANQWVPLNPASAHGKASRFNPPAHLPRPCWLLDKPLALLIRDQRPFYGSPLKLVSPAERIESGWWSGELVQRDYFVAQGQDHVYYWIFRERLSVEPRWYLHGLFG